MSVPFSPNVPFYPCMRHFENTCQYDENWHFVIWFSFSLCMKFNNFFSDILISIKFQHRQIACWYPLPIFIMCKFVLCVFKCLLRVRGYGYFWLSFFFLAFDFVCLIFWSMKFYFYVFEYLIFTSYVFGVSLRMSLSPQV